MPKQNINVAFCREALKSIVADVRKLLPGVKLNDAWVYHLSNGRWEFHYESYYWQGSADNAYEARFKGWEAYMSKMEVGEYGKEQ